MPFLADRLIENLKLKKSILMWKTCSAVVILALLFFVGYTKYDVFNLPVKSSYIGRITINGFIGEDLKRDTKIRRLKDDKQLEAVVLHINSPGGGIVGSESLYNALRELASTKHMVVVMDSLAASGGYMIALAADHIVSHVGTITGSVGVIMQVPNLSKLSEMIGVNMNTIRSGNLKGEPSMFSNLSKEAKDALQRSLCTSFDFFLNLVEKRRNITDPETIKQISTGKIFVGKEALDAFLVDELGGEQDALNWLKSKNISSAIKDINLSVDNKFSFLGKAPKSVEALAWNFALEKLNKQEILAILPTYVN